MAEKLLKDVVPEGAPQDRSLFGATFRNAGLASYPCVEEIISATSKKDEIGHRIDIIELFG